MKDIDLSALSNNELELQKIVKGFLGKSFQHVELRTCNEGLDSLNYYLISKEDKGTPIEALIALFFFECHVVEDWTFSETKPEHIESITKTFLIPELKRYHRSFKSIESSDNSIRGLLKTLNEYLGNASNYDYRYSETQAGVYLNSRRLPFDQRDNIPSLAVIIAGISLMDEWNDVVYFLETMDHYILFQWGTSA